MMKLLLLASVISGSLCLNIPLEAVAKDEPDFKAAVNASSCPSCVLVKAHKIIFQSHKFNWFRQTN